MIYQQQQNGNSQMMTSFMENIIPEASKIIYLAFDNLFI
jgi:hypothetical protein